MPSWKVTVIDEAPLTTWAAVTMLPLPSTTKPVPVAVDLLLLARPPNGEVLAESSVTPREVMSTTPAAVLANSVRALRPPLLELSAAGLATLSVTVVVVEPPSPPASATTPAPATPPRRATTAIRAARPRRV